eukprot:TRINITY_DN25467_c1_g1_i1.p1 TRINITY_DN25467_c1_g1~~TRINITY_DN25467_c1_g1_i1.p1  ORF type:complete len:344 (+),score=54.40 TRINITY_DN25467_c1_g1_i1:67-1032(+)
MTLIHGPVGGSLSRQSRKAVGTSSCALKKAKQVAPAQQAKVPKPQPPAPVSAQPTPAPKPSEPEQERAPLFHDAPRGTIAQLLFASSLARAASVPAPTARSRKANKKKQPAAKAALAEEQPDEKATVDVEVSRRPRLESEESSRRWQAHLAQLESLLKQTDCTVVVEDTFVSVAHCSQNVEPQSRPATAPASLACSPRVHAADKLASDDGRHAEQVSTPQAWPSPLASAFAPASFELPALTPACAIGDSAIGTETSELSNGAQQDVAMPENLPRGDTHSLLQWLLRNAVSTNARIASLEAQVSSLQAENKRLRDELKERGD